MMERPIPDIAYAEVFVDIAASSTDRPFHYRIPDHLRGCLQVGHRVCVPFGHRMVEGVVVGFSNQSPVDGVREIEWLLEPEASVVQAQIDTCRWLASRYLCTMPQALRCVIPPGARGQRVRPNRRRMLSLAPEASLRGPGLLEELLAPKQRLVLKFLFENPGVYPRADLARLSGGGTAAVKALLDKGILAEHEVRVWRLPSPRSAETAPARCGPRLLEPTEDQAKALSEIERVLAARRSEVFLLHGVTGSGKTEVYIRAVEKAVAQGRQGLVLVPEIALTPQLRRMFQERFGGRVAILHSALSPGERYDQWDAIRNGAVDVVLGARSAVFAPLPRPGVIVVDEEHETSYKQEETPRYHAREVAIEKGRQAGAAVILGSATPSIESYRLAEGGHYRLLEMPRRIDNRPLPLAEIVDMRVELVRGNRGIFSERLFLAIQERLARGEQVLLFLNRRGFHTFVLCRECGNTIKCPNCAVALTLHMGSEAGPMRCHYCHFQAPVPALCPACQGRRIRYFGTGTQRVEEVVRQHFPQARVIRMDVDTTGTRGAHERLYETFRSGKADILVGTQMIAKGWDVSGVTLVGVISADTSLHLPDFRSGERTFQLLTQVAGRAGRGAIPGEVIIQTYNPEHYAIQAASRHDYMSFYKQEVAFREQFGYPPFSHFLRIVVSHHLASEAERVCRELALNAQRLAASRARVLGPASAPLSRLNGRYRWHFILSSLDLSVLLGIGRDLRGHPCCKGDAHIVFDVDPVSVL